MLEIKRQLNSENLWSPISCMQAGYAWADAGGHAVDASVGAQDAGRGRTPAGAISENAGLEMRHECVPHIHF